MPCAETLTRREETQQGEDYIVLEEIHTCIDDILHDNQDMGAFLRVQAHGAAEAAVAPPERRNDRRHSNNYRSERSIPKAVVACLVAIYNRRSEIPLTWQQMTGLIGSAIEYAFDRRFAVNHPEDPQLVGEDQRKMCIRTVEKTTRDNIAKIFSSYNQLKGYRSNDNMYVSMSQIGCAERSKEERTIILSLLMISAVNHRVLCSMTTRSRHQQTMDQELSIENIFRLCVDYLDHSSYEPTNVPVVPEFPRPPTSSAQAAGGATDDDEMVTSARRTTFGLRLYPAQQPGESSQRSGDVHENSNMQYLMNFMRGHYYLEDSIDAAFQEILEEEDEEELSWDNYAQP
eukprot:jgi/Picsp_1/658/NSC_00653-R1_---NA---